MIEMRDLRPGVLVYGPVGQRGRVKSVTRAAVTIEYTDKGGSWTVVCTREWFDKYPGQIKPAYEPPGR